MTAQDGLGRTWTLANLITMGRMLLVPAFVLLIQSGRDVGALAVYALAGASDLVDGWLARHRGQATRLGAVLDPAADKLLVAAAYLLLSLAPGRVLVPLWLTVLVLMRDLLISLVVIRAALAGRRDFSPSRLGKWTTAVQVGFVVWALVVRAFELPATGLGVGLLVVAVITVASGSSYLLAVSRAWLHAD